MTLIKSASDLDAALQLAESAAKVAQMAQPYPTEGAMYPSLERLANALSDASLRCLEESLLTDQAGQEDPTAGNEPES